MIYEDLPFSDYLKIDAVSKSDLDLINRSPMHYKYFKEHPKEPTQAMELGRMVHMLVLQPEEFYLFYFVLPEEVKVRRGKEFEKIKEENEGKTILTSNQFKEALEIKETVMRNPVAKEIIDQSKHKEVSIEHEDFSGLKRKGRLDILYNNTIYDLKTTSDCSIDEFMKTIYKYRYHVQAAYYLDLLEENDHPTLKANQFGFIVVETKEKPYKCTVYHQLSKQAVEIGRANYNQNIELLKECLETDVWVPNVQDEYKEISII